MKTTFHDLIIDDWSSLYVHDLLSAEANHNVRVTRMKPTQVYGGGGTVGFSGSRYLVCGAARHR